MFIFSLILVWLVAVRLDLSVLSLCYACNQAAILSVGWREKEIHCGVTRPVFLAEDNYCRTTRALILCVYTHSHVVLILAIPRGLRGIMMLQTCWKRNGEVQRGSPSEHEFDTGCDPTVFDAIYARFFSWRNWSEKRGVKHRWFQPWWFSVKAIFDVLYLEPRHLSEICEDIWNPLKIEVHA